MCFISVNRTGVTCLLASFSLSAVPAGAQQPAGPAEPLRLSTLLEAVERTHPRLDAARALERAARAKIAGATRPPDPQLQLGWMNYELFSLKPMEGIGMTQLQLMQMLPLGGKLRLAGLAESTRADAAGVRVSAVASDLRARAAMAFYELYAIDGSLMTMHATRRLLQDVAAVAAKMYEVGEGRQADVLRAQVEIARMDEDLIRMGAMRETMVARLNALRGSAHDAPIHALSMPVFPQAVPTLDSLVPLADRERPMLRAAALDVEAAAASARVAEREIWPDLQVGVQYGQQPGPEGAQRMGSIMLGASLPVFARQRQYQMREEANAMRAMAAAELAAMRAESQGALGEALAALGRAQRLSVFYRTAVLPQSEAAVSSALAAYRVGAVDFMSLLDAQMTRGRYLQELYALDADEGKAWAELEMLTGGEFVDAHSERGIRSPGGSPQ